jgi:hypothetical protein
MRISAPGSIILAAPLLVTCCGCGPAASHHAATIPVQGKMTYKGRPLTRGVVEFEPRNSGRTASGALRPDGTFVLGTFQEGDGAVAGRHRVSVTGTGGRPGGTASTRNSRELVPRKYTQPNTSGLEAVVGEEKTEFTFDLK